MWVYHCASGFDFLGELNSLRKSCKVGVQLTDNEFHVVSLSSGQLNEQGEPLSIDECSQHCLLKLHSLPSQRMSIQSLGLRSSFFFMWPPCGRTRRM